MPKLKYYVELEPGNKTYREYLRSNRFYMTRKELSEDMGKVFKINGVFFTPAKMKAEPAKKNTFFEIILSAIITSLLLYFIPAETYHVPVSRWAICLGLSCILGILLGRMRIDFQKTDADFFNLSNVS